MILIDEDCERTIERYGGQMLYVYAFKRGLMRLTTYINNILR
jgi:hypothetical protein